MSAANILSVDDNDDVREITALLLRDYGYNVIEASSGSAALGRLETNEAIDLLMVDLVMPVMSGPELLERVRAKRPDIRVALITGYADRTWIDEKCPNEILIKKPYTAEQVVAGVRRALGKIEK
jgi:CheY-like chemotaxis protein